MLKRCKLKFLKRKFYSSFLNKCFTTSFGHQDKILAIDSLMKERCVTCGARDRSVRMWKIVEESQLLFNAIH